MKRLKFFLFFLLGINGISFCQNSIENILAIRNIEKGLYDQNYLRTVLIEQGYTFDKKDSINVGSSQLNIEEIWYLYVDIKTVNKGILHRHELTNGDSYLELEYNGSTFEPDHNDKFQKLEIEFCKDIEQKNNRLISSNIFIYFNNVDLFPEYEAWFLENVKKYYSKKEVFPIIQDGKDSYMVDYSNDNRPNIHCDFSNDGSFSFYRTLN